MRSNVNEFIFEVYLEVIQISQQIFLFVFLADFCFLWSAVFIYI